MGFYNIVLEGQQAEEYKARKAKEAEEKEEADREAYKKRYGQDSYTKGIRGNLNYGEVTPTKEDKKRLKYASKFAFRNTDMNPSDKEGSKRDLEYTKDAANRNMRRHPDKWDRSRHESGIFESVEFLNEAVDRVKLDVYGREFSLKVYFSQYKGEEITEQQEIAYERFIKNKKVDENSKDKVINYIENNYKKDLSDNDTKNIFKYLIPKTIFIPRQDGMKRSIILLCDFKFDIEHGIGILFENEKMTDIGLQDEFL